MNKEDFERDVEVNLRLPVEWLRRLAHELRAFPEEQKWALETPLGNLIVVQRRQITDKHGTHDVLDFTVNPGD